MRSAAGRGQRCGRDRLSYRRTGEDPAGASSQLSATPRGGRWEASPDQDTHCRRCDSKGRPRVQMTTLEEEVRSLQVTSAKTITRRKTPSSAAMVAMISRIVSWKRIKVINMMTSTSPAQMPRASAQAPDRSLLADRAADTAMSGPGARVSATM